MMPGINSGQFIIVSLLVTIVVGFCLKRVSKSIIKIVDHR